MKTGKVIGNIWATRKEERFSGMKLLIVQPFNPMDDTEIEYPVVASDIIGAGIGETVLYVNGSSARTAAGGQDIPVDAAVVAIIDDQEIINFSEEKYRMTKEW